MIQMSTPYLHIFYINNDGSDLQKNHKTEFEYIAFVCDRMKVIVADLPNNNDVSLYRAAKRILGIGLAVVGVGALAAAVTGALTFTAAPIILAVSSVLFLAASVYLIYTSFKGVDCLEAIYLNRSHFYQALSQTLQGNYSKAVDHLQHYTNKDGTLNAGLMNESIVNTSDAVGGTALYALYGTCILLKLREQILSGEKIDNDNINHTFNLADECLNSCSRREESDQIKELLKTNILKAQTGDISDLKNMYIPSYPRDKNEFIVVT